jgi:hypothetical protein
MALCTAGASDKIALGGTFRVRTSSDLNVIGGRSTMWNGPQFFSTTRMLVTCCSIQYYHASYEPECCVRLQIHFPQRVLLFFPHELSFRDLA